MSKFEPKSPKGSVPNGQSYFAVRDAIRWFKCKLKPPKNQPAPTPVAATDLEADVTAQVDDEYDTDELAELPTDSDSEAVESEQGEDPAQIEGQ